MYEDLDEDELKYIRFVAANPDTIEDTSFETPNGTDVIKEWELPKYDPALQKNNWWIGGVVHHVIANKICKTQYMGFAQHDFRFKKGSIRNLLAQLKPGTGVHIRSMNFKDLVKTSTFGMYELNLYEYALTQLPRLKLDRFPIYHACFCETRCYEEIIDMLMSIDRRLFEFHNQPGDPIYRFAITSERTLALALGTVLDNLVEIKDIIHEEKI